MQSHVIGSKQIVFCLLMLSLCAIACSATNEWNIDSGDGRTKRCDECVDNERAINRTINENESAISLNSSEAKTPIDWQEVEDNFNKVLSEDEVFHKWDTMEANMKSGFDYGQTIKVHSSPALLAILGF